MESLDNKRVHEIELDMLSELNRISKRHKIKYYLAYGTALGAVRNNGFIPWDTDVDVIVEYNNTKKLDEILSKELSGKYRVLNYKNDSSSPLMFSRIVLANDDGVTVHVDLFPMVGLPNRKIKQQIFIKTARIVNALFFFKKVEPEKYYTDRNKKIRLSKILKVVSKPFPIRMLI